MTHKMTHKMTRMYRYFIENKLNGGCRGNRCWLAPRLEVTGVPSIMIENKSSKQSALAVKSHLRDNQHQSPDRPRYALA